jgi:hypothetical protein
VHVRMQYMINNKEKSKLHQEVPTQSTTGYSEKYPDVSERILISRYIHIRTDNSRPDVVALAPDGNTAWKRS